MVQIFRVFQYPEQSPKINWALYKKTLPKPALVDEFEKQFNALQIPYPPDTLGGQLDTLENEIKSDVAKYKTESNARIDEWVIIILYVITSKQLIFRYKKQLAHLAALISYDQMTMEDVRDALPDIAVDSLNKPTFWPHTPEEQLDYKDKEEPSAH